MRKEPLNMDESECDEGSCAALVQLVHRHVEGPGLEHGLMAAVARMARRCRVNEHRGAAEHPLGLLRPAERPVGQPRRDVELQAERRQMMADGVVEFWAYRRGEGGAPRYYPCRYLYPPGDGFRYWSMSARRIVLRR